MCQLILEELGNMRDQLVEGGAVGGGDEQGAQVEAVEQVGELQAGGEREREVRLMRLLESYELWGG